METLNTKHIILLLENSHRGGFYGSDFLNYYYFTWCVGDIEYFLSLKIELNSKTQILMTFWIFRLKFKKIYHFLFQISFNWANNIGHTNLDEIKTSNNIKLSLDM